MQSFTKGELILLLSKIFLLATVSYAITILTASQTSVKKRLELRNV